MELYSDVAAMLSGILTKQYSTSFSAASSLFPASLRRQIFNIYGFVRIADEVVDTYQGRDSAQLLDALETECYEAIKRGFSTNPIVQAFADTAGKFGIGKELIGSFFESMRMDLTKTAYNQKTYDRYIYGSAEVVGLMCLKVFCDGDKKRYKELAPGAMRLGAAYQKVNFLRDVAYDYQELGRFYFPGTSFNELDESQLRGIIDDIQGDFDTAKPYVLALPTDARKAVSLSYRYYETLLSELKKSNVDTIKSKRIRVPNAKKLRLLVAARTGIAS